MKKSVVLLITLSIISVLSIIIMNNLNSIDGLINKRIKSNSETNAFLLIDKTNEQILKLLKDNKEYLEENLPIGSIDFSTQNNKLFINYLGYHEKIYQLANLEKTNFNFKRFLKERDIKVSDISNYKQQDYILSTYLSISNDNRISEIINDITYIDDIHKKDYFECFYTFSHQNIEYKVRIIFNDSFKKVKEFEVWN